jgi:hypothetical protein
MKRPENNNIYSKAIVREMKKSLQNPRLCYLPYGNSLKYLYFARIIENYSGSSKFKSILKLLVDRIMLSKSESSPLGMNEIKKIIFGKKKILEEN